MYKVFQKKSMRVCNDTSVEKNNDTIVFYKWTIPKPSVEILHKHLNSNEINKNANITAESIIQIRLEAVSNSNATPMGTEEIVMHYLFFIQKGPLAPFPIQNIKNLSLSFSLSLSLSSLQCLGFNI